MYDLLVYIGRFQPFHRGHLHVVEEARKLAHNVLILMGSYGARRNYNNPFSDSDRAFIIHEGTKHLTNISIQGIEDYTYRDNLWVANVQRVIREKSLELLNGNSFPNHGYLDAKVGIIGFNKDHTSYYLKKFPLYTTVELEVPYVVDGVPLSASMIRESYYEDNNFDDFEPHIFAFDTVESVLDDFSPEYWEAKQYRKTWGSGPFITADSLVQVGANILLIERKDGTLALPGGFINPHETLLDASIRELREETKIKVPEKVLRGSLIGRQVFDKPDRDLRARIVTECFHYNLVDEFSLPEVRGSDDAVEAFWLPLDRINKDSMFDFYADHYHIIKCMTE